MSFAESHSSPVQTLTTLYRSVSRVPFLAAISDNVFLVSIRFVREESAWGRFDGFQEGQGGG